MNTPGYVSGRGCKFVIDGPDVEIIQDSRPATRLPLTDLLEFAQNHGLRSGEVDAPPLKNYGFNYEYEGKSFVFHIVAHSVEEAVARVEHMGKAIFEGELKSDLSSFFANLADVIYQPPSLRVQQEGISSTAATAPLHKLKNALETARHELVVLHGLKASDGKAPGEAWSIDTNSAIKQIDEALAASV